MFNDNKNDLNAEIIKLINTGKKEYKYYSSIDKFRYANKVMNLSRDYCCKLWNIDKENIDTYFFSCDSFSGANFDCENGKHAFGVSLNSVLVGKPFDLFIISFHEMRHIYQDLFMKAEDNRSALNYSNGDFDNLGWYSSGAEIDADKFSYSSFLGFIKSGIEAKKDNVTKLDYFSYKFKSDKNEVFHKVGEKIYSNIKPFFNTEREDEGLDEIYEEGNEDVKCLQIDDIERLASEYYDIFNYQPKSKDRMIDNTKRIAEDVIDIINIDLESIESDFTQSIEQ